MTDKTHFQLLIADIPFQITTFTEKPFERCVNFILEEEVTPKHEIILTEEDLEFERGITLEYYGPEGLKYIDPEIMALQTRITRALNEEDVILMHACSVKMDGKAYLFTAHSGTGKTTHSNYWKEVFGDRMSWLNDDKPFIKVGEDEIIVYGSPWMGKERRGENTSAPLAGIACLEQAKENAALPMSRKEKWAFLADQIQLIRTPEGMIKSLSLIERLIQNTNVIKLQCRPDVESVMICYNALNDGLEEKEESK